MRCKSLANLDATMTYPAVVLHGQETSDQFATETRLALRSHRL
jgi:hypothetical protein